MKSRELSIIAVLILLVGFGVGRWSMSPPEPSAKTVQDQKIAEIFKLVKEAREDQVRFEKRMEPQLIEIETRRLEEIRRNSITVLMWPDGHMNVRPTAVQNQKLDKLWD